MSTAEGSAGTDSKESTPNGSAVESSGPATTDQRRTISREQRSAAAKRGWITRKKRKP